MKKFLLSAAAASMVAAPLIAAAPAEAAPRHEKTVIKHKANGKIVVKQRRAKGNRMATRRTVVRQPIYRTNTRVNYRPTYRTWARGQRFDAHYASRYRVVDYRGYNGLYAPPRGYQWAQSGDDAVLVAIASGLIGAVVGGAFLN